MKLRNIGVAMVAVTVMAGCQQDPQAPSREQAWIEAHPTHAGPGGECVEFDDEPCDQDPFDLDDLDGDGVKVPSLKPAVKVSPAAPKVNPKPVMPRRPR